MAEESSRRALILQGHRNVDYEWNSRDELE